MKNFYCVIVFLLAVTLNAQLKISGIVKDRSTKEPLKGASIFAPNTTIGGTTDESGYFSLTLADSQPEVIISFVGYESVIAPITSFTDNSKHNTIYLIPATTVLNEVVVKKISAKQREKYLDIFTREFIGLSKTAKTTKLLNPEVLQFEMNESNMLLNVTADAPLQLINKETGYQISYELVFFESKTLAEQHHQHMTTYFGYPYFKDIVTAQKLNPKIVAKNRLQCYSGSTMHFIRSLYTNTSENEGFALKKFKRELNPNYPSADSVKMLYERAKKEGFRLHLPSKFIISYDKIGVKANQIVFEKDHKKYLYFQDFISVLYRKAEEDDAYVKFYHLKESSFQTSQLQLVTDKPIEIYPNGNYGDVDQLATFGYMGWRKMGESLPFDYQPNTNTD